MTSYSRRQFLKMSGLTAAFLALSACKPAAQIALETTPTSPAPTLPIPSPIRPSETMPAVIGLATPTPVNLSGDATELARLVRRITFGLRPVDFAHAQQIGYNRFIDEQIDYLKISDAELDARLAPYQTLSLSPQDLRGQFPKKITPANELVQTTLIRAAASKRQLYELMVDFWSNHFNIYLVKENIPYLKPLDDRDVIRKFALGKFSDILSASAHSPAMLDYLDNHISTKNKPNENYARELLELHTLGVDGGYTQNDVKEVARALTGWSYTNGNQNFGEFNFKINQHDRDAKTILGNAFPSGKGIEDGEKVIDLLAHHSSTAHFIAAKLVRRFVSDTPPASLITLAAETFKNSDGDIASVLRVILHSAEFRASLGSKLKRPFEWIISALRAVDVPGTFDKGSSAFLEPMGQPIFRWPTPDGFPDNADAWVTTGGLLARWNFALALAFNTLKDSPVDFSSYPNIPANPAAGIDQISRRLLGEPLPLEAAGIIENYVRSADSKSVLPGTVALILASPYFQYR